MADDNTDKYADVPEDELPETQKLLRAVHDLPLAYNREMFTWRLLKELPADELVAALATVNRDRPVEAVKARHLPGMDLLAVEAKAHELRINELARQRLRADQRAEAPAPVSLADLLDEPDEPVLYRIDKLWPVNGRVVLAAQNKSGKTTLTGNVIRCLVDGEDFLSRYKVEPVQRVVLIDDEMSRTQVRRWLKDQGIRASERVQVVPLRGALSSFDILDPAVRQQWAEALRGADVLVFDCLRPALDSLGLDENLDAGRFLVALDELCRAAGIAELLLVHHMGHSNERSRGSSRIEDWPDVKWKLVKQDADDERSPRYFSAYGRDVDEPESRLSYDWATRHLTIDGEGTSRREAKLHGLTEIVGGYIEAHPGVNSTDLVTGLGKKAVDVRAAVQTLVSDNKVRVESGPKNSRLHFWKADDHLV